MELQNTTGLYMGRIEVCSITITERVRDSKVSTLFVFCWLSLPQTTLTWKDPLLLIFRAPCSVLPRIISSNKIVSRSVHKNYLYLHASSKRHQSLGMVGYRMILRTLIDIIEHTFNFFSITGAVQNHSKKQCETKNVRTIAANSLLEFSSKRISNKILREIYYKNSK